MQPSNRSESASLSAFITGALVGAGVALLLAPQSGSQMRGLLRDYAARAKDDLDEVVYQVADSIVERGQEDKPVKKALIPKVIHKVPKVPITIDNIQRPPEDVLQFNGRRLLYLPIAESGVIKYLAIFTTEDLLKRYFAENKPVEKPGPDSGLWPAECYIDKDYKGDMLPVTGTIENLKWVRRYWFSSWNDEISSIKTISNQMVFFEHSNFRGSELRLWYAQDLPNLRSIGWNDKISSIYISQR